jgi:hypothetical protein
MAALLPGSAAIFLRYAMAAFNVARHFWAAAGPSVFATMLM